MNCFSEMTPGTLQKPRRKNPRLQGYDYASPGMYFVTICTNNREMFFGAITDGQLILSDFGNIAVSAIAFLPLHYEFVQVDCSVVMPNHVHLIVTIVSDDNTHTLGNIVRGFKSEVSRKCGRKIWQRGFHEHIIRNEQDLQEIRSYIANNPVKWEMDRHNPKHQQFENWREPSV